MTSVETIERNGYVARIEVDFNPMSPREFETFGEMVSWHRRMTVGDRDGLREGLDPTEFTAELREQKALIVPVYMLDHSGQTIRTTPFNDPWDSGQVGIIYTTVEKIRSEYGADTAENRALASARLASDVDTYNQWASGDVFGFVIEKDGVEVDACWGFYGLEYVRGEVNERLDELPPTLPLPETVAS